MRISDWSSDVCSSDLPKGNGDVAPHRDLLRISCECVEAETAGAEPNRLLQVGRQTGTPFRQILRPQPEMLVEDALQTTIDYCTHNLFDSVGTGERREDHGIVEIRPKPLPTQANERREPAGIEDGRIMATQRAPKHDTGRADRVVNKVIELFRREAVQLGHLPPFFDCSAGSSEERPVGKECVSKCNSRWSPGH